MNQEFHGVNHQTKSATSPSGDLDIRLYARNSLDKARRIFERARKHRPRICLTIRQSHAGVGGVATGRDGAVSATGRTGEAGQKERPSAARWASKGFRIRGDIPKSAL